MELGPIGEGLATRLRELVAAMRRYDAFVGQPGQDPPPTVALCDGDEHAAATVLVLRALRTCADPVNWRLLERLTAGEAPMSELAVLLGCPGVAAWEQVNDLVQVGVVARAVEHDRVTLTAAGDGMVAMIEAMAGAAAKAVVR